MVQWSWLTSSGKKKTQEVKEIKKGNSREEKSFKEKRAALMRALDSSE